MRQKALEKGEVIIEELISRFGANMDSIEFILSELESKGWANKAIQEYETIQKDLRISEKDK